MLVRQGTIEEMLSIWYKRYTSEFLADRIRNNQAEFWTIEMEHQLVGELYVLFELDDKDFADAKTTAYLCAFRIADAFRGKGLGTMLMLKVLERLLSLGYMYATIGVDQEEAANERLYKRLGFAEKVKSQSVDPCDVDAFCKPVPCKEFDLLKKVL